MAELRRDPVSGSWVVVGLTWVKSSEIDVCPFCPGNEHLPGKPIREVRDAGGAWLVRCFPAANPMFMIEALPAKKAEGMYDRMGNVGAHELVVEGRTHTKTLSDFDEDELALVFDTYAERILDLKKDKRFRYVQVYRNHGDLAGSYIYHPHSHILATSIIPHGTVLELANSKDHYLQKERCLLCDIIAQEIRQNKRVVALSENFLAFCPFAPKFPFEVCLAPRFHSHTFESLIDDRALKYEFIHLLLDVVRRVERARSSHTIVIHTAPNTVKEDVAPESAAVEDYFHWRVEIMPRDLRSSKFKREDEFYNVSLTPEEAAQILKSDKS
jgi:UDPglucose--hexose-1-phosphate uridylyltransferase